MRFIWFGLVVTMISYTADDNDLLSQHIAYLTELASQPTVEDNPAAPLSLGYLCRKIEHQEESLNILTHLCEDLLGILHKQHQKIIAITQSHQDLQQKVSVQNREFETAAQFILDELQEIKQEQRNSL